MEVSDTITDTTAVGPIKTGNSAIGVFLSGTWDSATVTLQKEVGGSFVAHPGGAWTDDAAVTVDCPGGGVFRLVGSSIGGSTSITAAITS